MSIQKTLEYNSLSININNDDFWNATELIQAAYSNPGYNTAFLLDWLKDNKELIEAVEEKINKKSVIYDEYSNIWLHPDLILVLAMYLNPKCYLWCYSNLVKFLYD